MSNAKPFCKIGDLFIVQQEGNYSELLLKKGSTVAILKAQQRPIGGVWPGAYWTVRVELSDFDADNYWLADQVVEQACTNGYWEKVNVVDAIYTEEGDLPPLKIGKRFSIDPRLTKNKTIKRLAKIGIDFKVMRKRGGSVEINTSHGNHGSWIFKEGELNEIRRKS